MICLFLFLCYAQNDIKSLFDLIFVRNIFFIMNEIFSFVFDLFVKYYFFLFTLFKQIFSVHF